MEVIGRCGEAANGKKVEECVVPETQSLAQSRSQEVFVE